MNQKATHTKEDVISSIADLVLSAIIGILVGGLCALFGRTLIFLSNLRDAHITPLLYLLPAVGLMIVFLYQKWGASAGAGMSLVFSRAGARVRKIDKRLIPLIMSTTWAGHLFGASVGREGVAVQMGACLSDALSRVCFRKFENISSFSPRRFVSVGMAAGFAGLFGTPFAAVAFALEVRRPGRFELENLIYAACAAFLASATSHMLGLESFHVAVVTPALGHALALASVLLGAAVGVAGAAFAYFLSLAKASAKKYLANPYIRMLVLSLVATALLLLVDHGRFAGLGTNLISLATKGQEIYWYDFLLKMLLTIVCLAAGFQGGEVTPLFAIGASLASVLAPLIGIDPILAAALGYSACFGAATNTLFAPTLICIEVFGASITPYALIAIPVAYIVSGAFSIYPQEANSEQ